MNDGVNNGKRLAYVHEKQKREREEETHISLIAKWEEDFRLPMGCKASEDLDNDNLEQATLDTQLTSSNVGYRLLQKMGWKGKGLGKDEQGITEPVRTGIRDPKLGIGKQEQDDFFTAEENVQRRKLGIELEESEENAKKREVIAEREQKIQTEVKEIHKVFFCNLCSKQYKLAVEFEAHLSSYDHNHRKRFKEMREMQGSGSRDDRQKREQLRHEREMARFAQVADAQKQKQQQELEQLGPPSDSSTLKTATLVNDHDQRQALKFGFSSKMSSSKKVSTTSLKAKKSNITRTVSSVFGGDSDEE